MDRRPQAREMQQTQVGEKGTPAATAAGATGQRQWFAGLAATQQF